MLSDIGVDLDWSWNPGDCNVASTTNPAGRPVFLHTGWRTCGTWIWSHLRASPRVLALYEPLHEELATLTEPGLGHRRADDWQSGHGAMPPYFAEYRRLLDSGQGGVRHFRAEFPYDDFFGPAPERDAALRTYLQSLVDAGRRERLIPVLKFCRSLGRVSWMREAFPDALHAVVVRSAAAQWESARRQYLVFGNGYFATMPLVVLARNARLPIVASCCAALSFDLPSLPDAPIGRQVELMDRRMGRHSWKYRYRGFLAFWTASMVAALGAADLVIDSEALGGSSDHRAAVEAALAVACDGPVRLAPQRIHTEPSPRGDALRAHRAAMEVVESHSASLPADALLLIREKLAVPTPRTPRVSLAAYRPARPARLAFGP
jgi:hypothetical protein